MSWVQVAISRSSEDIFDEDADEIYIAQKEWNSAMKKRLKEGYRDGIEAGKELALQEGFNQGYRQGAELMVTCGQFRGTLNALLSWCHLNGHDSALSKINHLLDVVGKREDDVLKYLNSTQEQSHLGDILDFVQDMDLSDTAPAGTECDAVKAGKYEHIGSSGKTSCRNNGKDDSLQSECSKAICTDPEKPTLAWVKEQTVWLVEQLGLSLDMLHHVQQLGY
ncbi:protein YAE1 homolog [Apteryx mantelli]|uniref:Protein YAE1 homolog n=1 Tax=Apteryx mantelli TaxID=2696672 RepID=A0A8B7JKC6_9AVES|nr:PREDICTED: yae1 domain-containing protein 1 [Apteryx mantelli mantelli]XP_013811189.1 PREDICTED: yae1 domain-containing protein 1 [Apteryx mantelli mantelli]XP_013811190.1 PREDICTED: yae1 domain-containing protein 1 [Apteryx mantelli mantelli]